MRWVRKSKYHEESEPPGYHLGANRVDGRWVFVLVKGQERIGGFDRSDKAKAEAERHDQDRNAAAA